MKLLTGKKAIEWSRVNENGTHEDSQWQKGHSTEKYEYRQVQD